MGRAYEVRKVSIQKNGLVKAKVYSNYAKEIYIAAKKGTDIDTNDDLKRLVEKALRSPTISKFFQIGALPEEIPPEILI